MVWTSEVSERRKPSLSASRMATRAHSGISSPSRSRLMPTRISKVPRRRIAQDLDPFQGLDVGMHVADLQPRLMQVFGEVFRHPLGQCRDQDAIALGGDGPAFGDQIVHLLGDRADIALRVDQAGRADHLFGEDAAGLFQFPFARGRGDEDRLRPHGIPFREFQRPVVDAGRQAEAVIRQGGFPLIVAPAPCRRAGRR